MRAPLRLVLGAHSVVNGAAYASIQKFCFLGSFAGIKSPAPIAHKGAASQRLAEKPLF